MCEEAGIEEDERITIELLSDGDFRLGPEAEGHINFHIALIVGTNYAGCISQEDADKLGQIAAPGIRLKWFLDYDKWKWTKNPKRSGATLLKSEYYP